MNSIDLKNKNSKPVFALAYGASGTGKTHLVGTLIELGTVLVIDIDKGASTLQYAKDLVNSPHYHNLHVVSFDQFKDLDAAYKLVMANDPAKWNAALNLTGENAIKQPFDWIAWDTWSELQWVMQEELRSKEADLRANGLNFRKNIGIQHWGSLTDFNKLAIHALRDCKVNQLFTMQEVLDKDELSGQIYGGPAIHGKMVQEMPTYFDVVIHTYVNMQGGHCAATKAKGKFTGKTRVSEPMDIQDPTMKKLLGR